MPVIKLSTLIKAPIEKCFDASRSIEIHLLSAEDTRERAVAGKTSGLCELNDEITWQATHFGIRQKLSVRIIKLERPYYFEDMMLKGAFKSMRHEHHFKQMGTETEMKDVFIYEVPLGFIGSVFDKLVLNKYMTRFLKTRNELIKNVCEKADDLINQ